mmetsp:Transcript_33550/g.41290  ORF Transcript_33550/g.41290 Transcript_33550/m.41290 type:complete len:376 (-) Transcript_33550:65-1192(-)
MGVCSSTKPSKPTMIDAMSHPTCDDEKVSLHLHEYSNQIKTISTFWVNNIDRLTDTEYDELGVELYGYINEKIPEVNPIFSKGKRGYSGLGRAFFRMFAWFVNELNKDIKPKKFMKHIRILGKIHNKMGIKPEWYPILLKAFNHTLSNKFPNEYNIRIQFCFDELYNIISDIMLKRDFYSVAIKNTASLSTSFDNLKSCLSNPDTLIYLEKYMKAHFCSEMILFWKDVQEYTSKPTHIKGKFIYNTYIVPYSEREINISFDTRMTIINYMKPSNTNTIMDKKLFNIAQSETVKMISDNIWFKFKHEMNALTKTSLKMAKNRQTPTPVSPNSLSVKQTEYTLSTSNTMRQLERALSGESHSMNGVYTDTRLPVKET